MQRLRLASVRQPLLSFMASSATPRCLRWPSSSLARPTRPRVSRFAHGSRHMASSIGVKGEEDLDNNNTKTGMQSLNPPGNNIAEYEKGGSRNAISGDEDACRMTLEAIDSKPDADAAGGTTVGVTGCEPRSNDNNNDEQCRAAAEVPDDFVDDVGPMYILPHSSHRDGSIYNNDVRSSWKGAFRIADRNETPLEAMRFSNPTDCIIRDGICMRRHASHMLQIFSLSLAKIPVEHAASSVELYGYIAARDALDPSLNYFVNVSRDDPIVLKQVRRGHLILQGSAIIMSGPKRGALLIDTTLLENDMKIKTGEHESEDLQATADRRRIDRRHHRHMELQAVHGAHPRHGDGGAIDLTAACPLLRGRGDGRSGRIAGTARQFQFRVRLSCFASGIHDEEIRLFEGDVGEPCGLKRFVVAVVEGSEIELRLKVDKQPCLRSSIVVLSRRACRGMLFKRSRLSLRCSR